MPTGLSTPEIGNTSAVEDSASARPRAAADWIGVPATSRPAAIRTAQPTSSALPTPNTLRPIERNRRKLMWSPAENSSRMMPSSANGSIECGSLIETVWSQGWAGANAPSA